MRLVKIHILIFTHSIYSTFKTYIEWQANPTITTIDTTAYPIKNVEFPAITICSQGSAKDVMDTVMLNQFESYLKSRGIKKTKSSQNGTRSKRSEEQTVITNTLSNKEVDNFKNNLKLLGLPN